MKKIFIFYALALFIISCKYDKGQLPVKKITSVCDSTVSYSIIIAPLTTTNCSNPGPGCHESGSSYGDFTFYAGLKAKVNNGSLLNRVVNHNGNPMPPAGLTNDQISKLNCWIKQGGLNN